MDHEWLKYIEYRFDTWSCSRGLWLCLEKHCFDLSGVTVFLFVFFAHVYIFQCNPDRIACTFFELHTIELNEEGIPVWCAIPFAHRTSPSSQSILPLPLSCWSPLSVLPCSLSPSCLKTMFVFPPQWFHRLMMWPWSPISRSLPFKVQWTCDQH